MKKRILITISLISLFCLSFSQSFDGPWSGKLKVQSTDLPLIFEFKYDGIWEGSMQSPKQSPNKFPLSSIQTQGDSIYLTLKKMGIQFSGKLSVDRNSILGKFQQGSLITDLILTRLRAEQVGELGANKRSQRVNPPYTYDTLDVNFRNVVDDISLSGTITRPKHAGKFPAVVLVSGSGPQDRNESLLGHEPFKVLADYLTKNGIIVLRYDDRGIGKSTGDFSKATTGDFGKDALAALTFLKSQPKVDANKLGVLGHSEGGLITFILAGQHVPDIKFIVSLAGPSIRMDSLLMLQNQAVMKSVGKKMTDKEMVMIRENFNIAKGDLPADQALNAIMKNMSAVPGSQNINFADQIGVLITPWYRHFLKIDPVPFIRKIKVPVFAGYGGKDIQVPAKQNMESLKVNLRSNNKDQIKLYPTFNHLFQKAKTGGVHEYGEIQETMNEELLYDIAAWIKTIKPK